MHGFDPEFRDLPGRIVKITKRIWEGRGIGLIRDWYSPDCLVHTANGPMHGAEAMVAGALATLHAFRPAAAAGGHHRVRRRRTRIPAVAPRLRAVGPPRRRDLRPADRSRDPLLRGGRLRLIGNRIVEEWLDCDEEGIAIQLGLDSVERARRLARADFTGFGAVDPQLAWAELAFLSEGVRIANARLG